MDENIYVLVSVYRHSDELWKPSTAMLCHDYLWGLKTPETMKTKGMELIISCHHVTSYHAIWHSVYLSSFLLRHTHSSSIVCLLSSVLHSTPIWCLSTLDIVLYRTTSHEGTDVPWSWLHNHCIDGLAFICMNVFDHLLICMNAIHDLNFNHSFSWQICYTYLQYFLSIELMFLVDE